MGFVADTIPPTLISDAVNPTESAVGDPPGVDTWVDAPVVVVLDDRWLAFPQPAPTSNHNAHAPMPPTRCPDLIIPPKDRRRVGLLGGVRRQVRRRTITRCGDRTRTSRSRCATADRRGPARGSDQGAGHAANGTRSVPRPLRRCHRPQLAPP